MPRAAGNKPTYTLRICAVGTDEKGNETLTPTETGIELPSVTTIIKRVWNSSFTSASNYGFNLGAELAEQEYGITDFKERANKKSLSPNTILKKRASEGTDAHSLFESLLNGNTGVYGAGLTGYHKQVYDYFDKNLRDKTIRSERKLFSLQGSFAGTADVVQVLDTPGMVRVDDLKTRKDLRVYDTDKMQVWAYAQALEEMYPELEVVEAGVIVCTPKTSKRYVAEGKFLDVWMNTLAAWKSLEGEAVVTPAWA